MLGLAVAVFDHAGCAMVLSGPGVGRAKGQPTEVWLSFAGPKVKWPREPFAVAAVVGPT